MAYALFLAQSFAIAGLAAFILINALAAQTARQERRRKDQERR